jgi:hypothetical protein
MSANPDEVHARYKDVIRVNKHRLDEEAENHAELTYNEAVNLILLKEEIEVLERGYKKKKAEKFIQVKKDPIMFNLDSASDKTVEALLMNDPELIRMEDVLRTYEKELAIRTAFLSALNARKSMINDLVTLHGQSYFAKTQTTGEAKKRVEEQAKASVRVPMDRPTPTKPKKPL